VQAEKVLSKDLAKLLTEGEGVHFKFRKPKSLWKVI
jgi:hypothetical protein